MDCCNICCTKYDITNNQEPKHCISNNEKIKLETDGRVKVHKVQCWEHGENMAEYYE